MVPEAPIEDGPGGRKPAGEGWFVVNAREAEWIHNEKFGAGVVFEGESRFPHYGINIQVLWPGQPNCYYHAEEGQEDFLVLSGECILLVEGEERPLRAWDFVHCPPWTEHVFVGAGDGPCAIVGVGARNAGEGLVYPVSEVALRHGAGVKEEATTGKVAYADAPESTQAPYAEGLPKLD
jgi:uncharacterized cupin superfamily protein